MEIQLKQMNPSMMGSHSKAREGPIGDPSVGEGDITRSVVGDVSSLGAKPSDKVGQRGLGSEGGQLATFSGQLRTLDLDQYGFALHWSGYVVCSTGPEELVKWVTMTREVGWAT